MLRPTLQSLLAAGVIGLGGSAAFAQATQPAQQQQPAQPQAQQPQPQQQQQRMQQQQQPPQPQPQPQMAEEQFETITGTVIDVEAYLVHGEQVARDQQAVQAQLEATDPIGILTQEGEVYLLLDRQEMLPAAAGVPLAQQPGHFQQFGVPGQQAQMQQRQAPSFTYIEAQEGQRVDISGDLVERGEAFEGQLEQRQVEREPLPREQEGIYAVPRERQQPAGVELETGVETERAAQVGEEIEEWDRTQAESPFGVGELQELEYGAEAEIGQGTPGLAPREDAPGEVFDQEPEARMQQRGELTEEEQVFGIEQREQLEAQRRQEAELIEQEQPVLEEEEPGEVEVPEQRHFEAELRERTQAPADEVDVERGAAIQQQELEQQRMQEPQLQPQAQQAQQPEDAQVYGVDRPQPQRAGQMQARPDVTFQPLTQQEFRQRQARGDVAVGQPLTLQTGQQITITGQVYQRGDLQGIVVSGYRVQPEAGQQQQPQLQQQGQLRQQQGQLRQQPGQQRQQGQIGQPMQGQPAEIQR